MTQYISKFKVIGAKFGAFVVPYLIMILGPSYKVRVTALLTALFTSTIDYWMSGGKMTPALLVAVWGFTIKAWFTKANNVTGIGDNATILVGPTKPGAGSNG